MHARSMLAFALGLTGATLTALPADAQPHALDSLEPGHWMVISHNTLEDVDPCPDRTCSYAGAEGLHGLVDDWVGGAFADGYGALGSLVLWGGGHGGYWGSEVYAFDVETGLWSRLSDPYPDGNACDTSTGQYPDGSPCPAHTYDAIEYHPGTNSLVPLASETTHIGGNFDDTPKMFDLGARAWRRGCERPEARGITGAASAYDPTRDLIWFLGAYNQRFASYDVDACTWTNYDEINLDIDLVAAVDPMRDLFVTIDGRGTQTVLVIDLASPSTAPVTVTTSGDAEPQESGANGFEYDPVTHTFVAWVDGASVHVLTPPAGDWRTGTWVWSRVDPAATNTVVPTPANDNGTYSRFRYVPSKNVFIVFNRADDPVFAYRLSPDIPPPRPRPDAGVPTGTDAGTAPTSDAGTAGGLDAAAVARDGSTSSPPGAMDTDGGCGCRVASSRGSTPLPIVGVVLVLGAVAVSWFRRGRRGSRTEA